MEFRVSEKIMKKWAPILEHTDMPEITDGYRKQVTAVLLENQQQHLREASPANSIGTNPSIGSSSNGMGGNVSLWDPILISLVRRAMPNLVAYDICGVQPMSGPTGLIFAMRSRYASQTGDEALFLEADTRFGGSGSTGSFAAAALGPTNGQYSDTYASDPFGNGTSTSAAGITAFRGYRTGDGEGLGDPSSTNPFAQMAFSIEKTVVEARTRALKAEYSLELAQDLKAVHGLDAETELANILSAEILAEINREVVRTIYGVSKLGARAGTTQTTGVFDLNVDSNGRWSAEKFKGLLFQIEREANQIAKETRRGKGNFVLCSSDVASALAMAGVLDYAPALNTNLNVDDTGNTFVGVLNGKFRVHIDPYASLQRDFFCVGYKGSSPFDAGLFYCPYVPLQMVRAVGQDTFQPKIAFKTRYGLVSNPFVYNTSTGAADGQTLSARSNQYYRIVRVDNLF
jgi:hypothetical protein